MARTFQVRVLLRGMITLPKQLHDEDAYAGIRSIRQATGTSI
jgi:hypothetical protein